MPYTELEADGLLFRSRKVALALLYSLDANAIGAPGCWFGGEPNLPTNIGWPTYYSKELDAEIPMHFILQMNLNAVPNIVGLPDMPRSGTIFVFIDQAVAAAWKGPLERGEGARVIYVPGDVSQFEARQAPPMPDLKALYRKNKRKLPYKIGRAHV